MGKYFDKRSLLTFTSFVLGVTLLYNLLKLSIEINGELVVYPYMITMLLASLFAGIGFLSINPKVLGLSSVLWLISIAFNFAAIIFIVPIVILNIMGRNKVLKKIENEENDEQSDNTSKNRD